MKQLLVPERCINCGSVFDLQYDIDEMDLYLNKFENKGQVHLCWACRYREKKNKKR